MCANFSSLLLKSAILILQKKEWETFNSLVIELATDPFYTDSILSPLNFNGNSAFVAKLKIKKGKKTAKYLSSKLSIILQTPN